MIPAVGESRTRSPLRHWMTSLIPQRRASAACSDKCKASPCTGTRIFGLTQPISSSSSARRGCPDTCTICVRSVITVIPWSISPLMMRPTAFSLPGMVRAEKITVSPRDSVTSGCWSSAMRETGYLEGVQDLRPVDAYGYLPPNKVVALCTGSQGEPRAALSRIAEDQHPDVTLSRGDTVIFSARTIPGNEKAVGRIINGLIDQGITVITDRTHMVHVSGHPRRAELEELIGWVRPKILVPVHGEALHLSEHAALARRCGIKEVIQCRNGDLVRLSPTAGIIDEVPSGRLYKDGSLLVEADARTVADRKRLSFAGAVSVALALNDKGVLAADPELDLIGIPERDRDGGLIAEAVNDAVLETLESLPRKRRSDPDAVAEAIRRAVRAAVAERWGKKPMCHVHVLTV